MNRPLVRPLVAVALVVAACTTPTDVCGCSIPPYSVPVVATVVDAADVPVAGARVALDGVPPTMSADPRFFLNYLRDTDEAGVVATRAYSTFTLADQALRAMVIRAGSTDTLRVRLAGTATFSREDADTVRVTVRLP